MKFMDSISRLFGGGAKADPKRNRLSVNLAEGAPRSERQSSPQSEISGPPKHLAFAENGDIAAEKKLVEPSNLATQHHDIENLAPLTPSEVRIILEATEATLGQFAASPRLFAKDVKGDTPLHIAARTGNLVHCDLFVRAGSNPATLNNEQQTPADVALSEGHRLVAQLLSSLLGEPLQQKELEGYQVSLEADPPAAVLGESGEDTLAASDEPVSDNEHLSAPEGGSTATWPDHRVQRLKALWAEGKSAGQIARELGGVSRNAVLSKLFRLGMLNKPRSSADSSEDKRILFEGDGLSKATKESDKAQPWPSTRADGQLSQNKYDKTQSQSNDRARGHSRQLGNAPPDSLPKEEALLPFEFAQDVATLVNPVQMAELDNLLSFEAEEEPEEFFDKAANAKASGTFVAVLNSSEAVFYNEDSDWELDLSPAPIAGEGIGSSNVLSTGRSSERDFLQVRNRGRQSVKKAVVQPGTRLFIDPDLCVSWAEEILAKGFCSVDDINRLVADCEGNGDLEELRINLQRNLEAAGFDLDQATEHYAALWTAASDTTSEDLAEAVGAALTCRTQLPGTQRFDMDKSEELQLLEPMMRAKQELQLRILASETAVETILDVIDSIREGSRDPGSFSLRTIIPSRPGHAETSEVMAAADALRSWHTTGRVMDGKRRREALAALEALDLSLAFHKELACRLGKVPACQAEASQLEAEILISESATEHLIRAHLPYVRRFASRNVEEGEDPEDVFQVAFMGLQRSTRRFDPERGYRFLIYASYWMRQAIMRWRADEGAAIRIPVHRNEKVTNLDRALNRLDVRVGGAVSNIDLAEELEWTIDEVRQFRSIPREAVFVDSLDDWDDLLNEQMLDEGNKNDQTELEAVVREVLASLTPREERILRMRFGFGMDTDHTLEEVGQQFSVTRERIRQIEAKALLKLKHPSRSRRLRAFLTWEE
jgi:RNA polymerase primary sigma factor